MKKHNGFTLIELMIVAAIIGILIAIAIPAFKGESAMSQPVKQTQCIEGLKFTLGNSKNPPTQLIGPNGGGITCDTVSEDSYSNENVWQY